MSHRIETGPSAVGTALVVIPGRVNYFYNTNGRRLAEAFVELGFAVDVRELGDCSEGTYDLCLLSNLAEVLHAFGDEAEGLSRVRDLGRRCGHLAALSMDSAMTPWYRRTVERCEAAGVATILDLGLWDQRPLLPESDLGRYCFVRDGLTGAERRLLEEVARDDAPRPIPWAFVGHVTAERAAFADYLVRHVDPTGFLYIPPLGPITEAGSPHLGHDQFRAVLRKSRFHPWCSHHEHFYLEPERFRIALLAGCVPLKVLMAGQEPPDDAPMRDLVVRKDEVPAIVNSRRDRWYRGRIFAEYRRHPLSGSLGRALSGRGVAVDASAAAIGTEQRIYARSA